MTENRVCSILGIKSPIISAAMWGLTNAEMVAAVSENGGLGILGPMPGQKFSGNLGEASENMRTQIQRVRTLTDKPFGVNLIPDNSGQNSGISSDLFEAYLNVMIAEKVPVALVVGSLNNKAFFQKLTDHHIKIIYRPNTADPRLIKPAEELGVDLIIATGLDEGGGLPVNDWLAGTFSIVPRFVDEATVPVIAAGGITDVRTATAAVALGAEGLYVGTRFLASDESPIPTDIKQLLVQTNVEDLMYLPDPTSETVRAVKTPSLPDVIAQIQAGELKGTGALLTGMLTGNLNTGMVIADNGISLIKEIQPIQTIMQELATPFS